MSSRTNTDNGIFDVIRKVEAGGNTLLTIDKVTDQDRDLGTLDLWVVTYRRQTDGTYVVHLASREESTITLVMGSYLDTWADADAERLRRIAFWRR